MKTFCSTAEPVQGGGSAQREAEEVGCRPGLPDLERKGLRRLCGANQCDC